MSTEELPASGRIPRPAEARQFLQVAKLFALPLMLLASSLSGKIKDAPSPYEKLVRSQGANLYTLAWPSATYKSVDIQEIHLTDGGADLTVVLRGRSAFDNSELWVQTLIKIRDGKFVDLRWNTHSPSLFRPGSTVDDLPAALRKLNEGRGPRDFIWKPRNAAEAAELRKQQAESKAFEARMTRRARAHRAKLQRLQERFRRGTIHLYNQLILKSSKYCWVKVAIHYKGLDGQWVTEGWWTVDGEEYGTWTDIMSIGSEIWLYAKSTRGEVWSGNGGNESLALPITPEHGFIQVENEVLTGPGLKVVPFFKLERIGASWSNQHFTFTCYR